MIYESSVPINVSGFYGSDKIPVYFSDGFTRKGLDIYDLSYCSSIGGRLPYLFAGYFYKDTENFSQWYFSNARRHEEMKGAIEQYLNRKDLNCLFGQIWFEVGLLNKGKLKFSHMDLYEDLPNTRARNELLTSIHPYYRADNFQIRIAELY